MSTMAIPDDLEKWISAYAHSSAQVYTFILRNFPIPQVQIRCYRIDGSSKYRAYANYAIKRSERDQFNIPRGCSEDREEAILQALSALIGDGKLYDQKMVYQFEEFNMQ